MNSHTPSLLRSPLLIVSLLAAVGLAGYFGWKQWRGSPLPDHHHDPGSHGGIIVAVGDDHYHVEALFEEAGVIKLFTLGQDQSEVISVPTQKITAYVRSPQKREATPMVLEPKPRSEDPAGETSVFEGQLPMEFVGSWLLVEVPSITMGKGRYRFSFLTQDSHEPAMPQKVTDAAERELYLKPGGKYTEADIKSNGSTTASEKFRGFMSAHDMHPAKGATICPITNTKANPKCTWIVGGKQYAFCCPPCIDEFVKLAKEHPEQIRDPADYVQE
jgi:hypothetical protein